MDAANKLKFTSRQRRWIWFCGAALASDLFCPPLTAQHTYKKPMELEFAVGAKTTHQLYWNVLSDMARSNMSRGVFAEGRLGVGGSNLSASFVRLRLTLDDWKRNAYSEYPQYGTAIQRVRGTIGVMRDMRRGSPNYAYYGGEFGISHWNIDSTHPLFGKEKYNTFAVGLFVVYQTEHIFLDFTLEFHSKGHERNRPIDGYINGEKHMPMGLNLSAGLSLGVGWKF